MMRSRPRMCRSLCSFLVWLCVSSVGSVSLAQKCPEDCVYGLSSYNVDLNPIRGSWEAVYYHGTEEHPDELVPSFFNISVCQALTNPVACNGAHVCYTEDTTSYHNLGAHGSCQYTEEDRMLTLSFQYSSSAEIVFGTKNVSITLICGSHLGVPEVIEGFPRDPIEIIWITSAACDTTSSAAPTINETKCYVVKQVFGSEGIEAAFIDLSGLIQNEWYLATDDERPDLQLGISVCRPIQVQTSSCDNSMACLIQGDKELAISADAENLPLAKLTTSFLTRSAPHFQGDLLTVEYEIVSDKVVQLCNQMASPLIRIRFFCASGDEVVGPQIEFIDDQLCLVNVVWYTMFACDVINIQSTGCQLITPYGNSFDLNGLIETSTNGSTGSSHYQYTILPCGEESLNVRCDRSETDRSIRVIQTHTDSLSCTSLGSGDGLLRYADNTLTLTFERGDTCHNGFARVSIITLICPADVKDLKPACPEQDNCLTFIAEQHCSYEFEWITSAACTLETTTPTCKFELSGTSYNLGLLTEDQDPTYTAITTEQGVECYLINPCGMVTTTSDTNLKTTDFCNLKVAPAKCGNTSVCRLNTDGSVLPMGVFDFRNPSTYHTVDKNVVSTLTLPTVENQQAVVQYVCQPGGLLTAPVFMSHLTENITEFYWATFASCPQGVQVGSGCAVREETTGYLFNLTSLENTSYIFNDSLNHYTYNIRVCDTIPSSADLGDCAGGVGMCQFSSTSSGHPHSTGLGNATLVYSNSLLKLTYTNGSACSNGYKRTTNILFYCDPDTFSVSVVNVSEIRHCDYLVEMKTQLACPPAFRSMECIYIDPKGNFYDLSELGRTIGNWEAEGPDGSVYIINVCRPLNLQGVGGCNPLSAVCRLGEGQGYPNHDLGYAASAYLYNNPDSGHLVLHYNSTTTGVDACPVVVTEIELVCSQNSGGGPQYIRGGTSSNLCHYDFVWETSVACPVQNNTVSTHHCSIKDSASGYTFNLLPLQTHEPYNLSTPDGYTYVLSICDNLKAAQTTCTDPAAICQQKAGAAGLSCGRSESMTLAYSDETLLLTYSDGTPCHHNKTVRSTEIVFACDRQVSVNEHMGFPQFQAESSYCHYSFVWPTMLACLPQTLSCLGMGGKYDLSPLMETSNWIIDVGDYYYVVGVCESINSVLVSECPNSAGVGACKYKPGVVNSGKILGYVTGDLIEIGEGHLELNYYNGDQCSSDSALRHMVHIHFHCQHGAGAGQPQLTSTSSDDCMTIIEWNTQYACSQDQKNKNSSWIIVNPATEQTYNLTKLASSLSASTVRDGKVYNYTVALGGQALPQSVCKQENVAICCTHSDGSDPIVIARTDSTVLEMVGGEVRIDYDNGDLCISPHKWAASVVFMYDSSDDFLELQPAEQCRVSFIVYTKLVHEEGKDIGIQCIVDNFNDLSWFSTSFLAPPISLGSLGNMYVSICRPISADNQVSLSTHYSGCVGVAGACIVQNDGSTVITGRPNYHYPPAISGNGNGVIITYPGGDKCSNGVYNTTILLTCSKEPFGIPVLVDPVLDADNPTLSSCSFIVEISSQHACPTLTPSSTTSETICSIKDPFDGFEIDLSSFASSDITVSDSKYVIGVCGPVKKSGCNSGSFGAGVCQQRDSGSWEPVVFANHSLTITSHSPHTLDVVYPTGIRTPHCEQSAILRIYCSTSNSSSKPFLVSGNGCQLQFSWPTRNLCWEEVEGCSATDPQDQYQFDLEMLVPQMWQGTMISDTEDQVLHFNMSVCRNLNPTTSEGSHCAPGPAGICLGPFQSADAPQYMNLGYMSKPPVVKSGAVVLNYTGGSICSEQGSTITTTVTLMCQTKWEDELHLQKVDECLYLLDWSTPLACKQSSLESSTCILNDSQSDIQYNFKSLARPILFKDVAHSGYNISVCLCPGGSCKTAYLKNVTVSNNHKVLLGNFHDMMALPNAPPQVEFIKGDACSDNQFQFSSVILMKCNRSEDSSTPNGFFYFEEELSATECRKYFSWWTPKACPTEEVSCSILDYDFSPLSVVDGYWKVTDGDETYLINICNPIHPRDTGCGNGVAVCRKNKDGSYTDLALLSTQVITIANGQPVIQFHGTQSCAQANVVFYMTCGAQSLTVHKEDSASCQLAFDWKTTFACKDPESVTHYTCESKKNVGENAEFWFDYDYLEGQQYSTSGSDGGKYYIQFCADAAVCGSGTSMCHVSSSQEVHKLGESSTSVFLQDGYRLQVSNSAKDGQVVVIIECAKGSGSQKISSIELDKLYLDNVYQTDGMTRAYFVIYTDRGCTFVAPPGTATPTGTSGTSENLPSTATATSSSSSALIVIIIVILVTVLILLVVVGYIAWDKYRREYVTYHIMKIFGRKSNQPVRYSRMKVEEVEATLMDSFDSDESSEEGEPEKEAYFTSRKSPDDKEGSKTESSQAEKHSDEELINI